MSTFLAVNKETLIRQANWMAEQTNDWMMIRDYMNNRLADMKLSANQQAKLRRYQFAYDQLSSGKYTESEVISQLQTHFQVNESTARQDIRHSREIYTTTLAIDKHFEIKMQLDLLKIEQQKARDSGNLEAYAKLTKCITELLKMAPEPVEQDDAFKPHHNSFDFNPAILGIPAIDKTELKELLAVLKAKHNFTADTSFIEDAEIIEDDAE